MALVSLLDAAETDGAARASQRAKGSHRVDQDEIEAEFAQVLERAGVTPGLPRFAAFARAAWAEATRHNLDPMSELANMAITRVRSGQAVRDVRDFFGKR